MKLNKFKALIYKLGVKPFSIIHNYHSPYQLFSYGRVIEFDDDITQYNSYIQAFLTKRRIHKKEIAPKINVLKKLEGYQNTTYIQRNYTLNVLFELNQLKYMNSIRNIDTAYWISIFFEDYEKNMLDGMTDKLIICGRVPALDDMDNYNKLAEKVNGLIKTFYMGEELSPYEREIERMYLILKQRKSNLRDNIQNVIYLIKKDLENSKYKRSIVHLTFSETLKIQGHLNFRMIHPSYFFKSHPIFEKVYIDTMFRTLYEVRYYSTDNYLSKIKLMYQYRESLLRAPERVKILGKYFFLQVFQYTDSFEFLNAFNLGLNFKESFYLIIMHMWLIIQRLKSFEDKDHKKYAEFLINEIIDCVVSHGKENFLKFQYLDGKSNKKLNHLRFYILKILDSYTFYFKVNPLTKANNYYYLTTIINTNIFSNCKDLNDKNLIKLSIYFLEHYNYLNNKDYLSIEKSDFDFSVSRVPINYRDYIISNSVIGREKMLENLINEDNKALLIHNYKQNARLMIANYGINFLFKYIERRDKNKAVQFLWENYGILPLENKIHYSNYDYKKNWVYRLAIFARRELNPNYFIEIEKTEEKEKLDEKKRKNTPWKTRKMELGLVEIDKFQQKSKIYQEKIK